MLHSELVLYLICLEHGASFSLPSQNWIAFHAHQKIVIMVISYAKFISITSDSCGNFTNDA